MSAVSISAVLGTLMAVGLARYRFLGKGLYRGISYLPLIIPDIAIAVANAIANAIDVVIAITNAILLLIARKNRLSGHIFA